jgi:hypothetical protein
MRRRSQTLPFSCGRSYRTDPASALCRRKAVRRDSQWQNTLQSPSRHFSSLVMKGDAETVEHAVLGQQIFTVWCNSGGRIQPQPTSDSLFEDLLKKDQLRETPLDELVAEAIEQGKNEPNDDILDMFETLHERLVRAEGMVAGEIARRRR